MEAYAKLNKLHISPRKVRLVVNLIRGKKVPHALSLLNVESKRASLPIQKLLNAAVANWKQHTQNNSKEEKNILYIKKIYVNSAGMIKRIKPAPQGRAHRIRKRMSHITVYVDKKPEEVSNL